jgi:chromate transporter
MSHQSTTSYTLGELVQYFLKLGTTGFGGPVALVGYMHKELVEERKWISEEEYKQGLALAQLAPGPLAAQLGIYIGYVHYRILGATLAGLAFVLPSFIMVIFLAIIYQLFGGLPWMQSIFYGVGASVIGIISISSYKLTTKSIGKFNVQSLKSNWLLWLFFGAAFVSTVITKQEQIVLFISTGLLYMFIKAPPKRNEKPLTKALLLMQVGFLNLEKSTLLKVAIFFLKAGAFVFGSGLAIVPFLHSGVVLENHWLTEQQFLDAVAVAMITPGPVVITVGFIGYLIGGISGASIAALSTFLPCYLFTIIPAPYFHKIANHSSIKAFVDGITASVIGALVGAVAVIGKQNITDVTTLILAVLTIVILLCIKKIQEPYIILVAALLGIILK